MSYQSVKALLSKGVSRPTLFQVMIPDLGRQVQDQLTFLCKTTAIPEINADTIVVNGHEAMGVTREQVSMITYSKPFQISVISDTDYTVYKAMREWFDTLAVNANPNQRVAGVQAGGSSQKVNYYNTITKQITLKKLEQNGEQAFTSPLEIEFNNAYPIRIGALSLDTESRDTYMEFNVSFTYETYTLNENILDTVEYE